LKQYAKHSRLHDAAPGKVVAGGGCVSLPGEPSLCSVRGGAWEALSRHLVTVTRIAVASSSLLIVTVSDRFPFVAPRV
jgi:hypothetical protein